ncbi:unnamed protein product [Closterium sp. NIES-54]
MANTPPVPLPPPIDAYSVDKLQLAADRSAINWHSFVGSIRRVLQDAFVGPYYVLDVLLRHPQALQPTAPNHPGEPPPLPPRLGPPPPEPNLTVAATPELQAAADATFFHNRREYLIRKADHDIALLNYEFASSERSTRLELIAEYNTSMAAYVSNSVAWAAADNRACTILLGALPDALMRRFQAREMRAHLIWTELQSMFERRDISSVGVLFQEYFSITLATYDGAVDYVGRMQEVADRLAACQAALSEPPADPPSSLQPHARLGRGGRGGSGGGGGPSDPALGGSSSVGGAVSRGGGRHGTLPPCTYDRRHGPHAGTPCGQTNHPPASCFKALDDAWFDRGNTGTPPRWNSVTPRPSLVDI